MRKGIAQALERKGRIFLRISRNDHTAPPTHQFINSQILKMAAIG